MVKHTEAIRRQLFECVWPFCGVVALRVKISKVLSGVHCVNYMPEYGFFVLPVFSCIRKESTVETEQVRNQDFFRAGEFSWN